jgi:hypothetical protein
MKETYSVIPIDESGIKSTSISDSPKESETFINNTQTVSEENARLLKQCFIWIALSLFFIFLFTTTIVLSGTAKCRNLSPTTTPIVPIPTPLSPFDSLKAHEKALSMFPNPKNTPKEAKHCGPNAATAIAKGCHLDIISFTWLPHECYDAELSAEFMSMKHWTWSLDPNGTALVTQDRVLGGEVDNGWVTWEYHLTHCLYTWKKLVRHLERGGAMDWYVMAYDHTRHCSKLLLQEGVDRNDYNSEFFVQYPMCGYA